jgi:hypothetical protein
MNLICQACKVILDKVLFLEAGGEAKAEARVEVKAEVLVEGNKIL